MVGHNFFFLFHFTFQSLAKRGAGLLSLGGGVVGFVGGDIIGCVESKAVDVGGRGFRESPRAGVSDFDSDAIPKAEEGALAPARLVAAMVTLWSPIAVVMPEIKPEMALTASPDGKFVAVNPVGPFRAVMGCRMEGTALSMSPAAIKAMSPSVKATP